MTEGYTGKHRVPELGEVLYDPDVWDAGSAVFGGVVDWVEDGDLSESARERMVRAGRTLFQGSVGAALVTAALGFLPVDVPPEAVPGVMAAVTAVVSWLHKKRK